jgi:C-terminal processing protease CtpA/Prc
LLVGVNLESVIVSADKKIGCRVKAFHPSPDGSKGQAERAGTIQPGDIIVAINGEQVLSQPFKKTVGILHARREEIRIIRFKVIFIMLCAFFSSF